MISDSVFFVVLIVALLALAYSIYVLVRSSRLHFNETDDVPGDHQVSTQNIMLDIVALQFPEVDKLLHPTPSDLTLSLQSEPDKAVYQAVFIAHHGTEQNKVVVDLNKRKDLIPLFEALQKPGRLAKGVSRWKKGQVVQLQDLRSRNEGRSERSERSGRSQRQEGGRPKIPKGPREPERPA